MERFWTFKKLLKNTGRNSKVPVDKERIVYLLGEIEKALNILKDFQKEGEKIIDEEFHQKLETKKLLLLKDLFLFFLRKNGRIFYLPLLWLQKK